jgi:DNA topoisomerase-2
MAPKKMVTLKKQQTESDAIADKYKKMDHQQHILAKPGMYIGSIESDTCDLWVVDPLNFNKMIKKTVKYVPGLFKIFDEILVNTIDHSVRLIEQKEKNDKVNLMKNINISIDKETGIITVTNDGDGIEVIQHPEHKIYVPEMIFGHLLTSTNYNDKEEKIVGGTNGIGAKCISLDTNVNLFNGEIKLAKDIKIGDILIGDDGNKRSVLNIKTGHGNMYEIDQTMGEKYKVNDEHVLTLHMPDHKVILWNTNSWKILWWDFKTNSIKNKQIKAIDIGIKCDECELILHSSIKRHYSRCHPNKIVPVKTRKSPTKNPDMNNKDIKNAFDKITQFAESINDNNIIDISIKDYLKLSKTTKSRLAGLRGNCVNWDYNHVDLDPYVLGLWLGDGIHTGYSYACDGENDYQLINYLIEWGKRNDANIRRTTNNQYSYGISSIDNFHKKGYAPLRKLLLKYDLVSNKHIPREYIINSREVRLNVLAGLIDTDGTLSRDGTRISITQGLKHKRLIDDLLYLARSLGFYCNLQKYKAKYTWKGEMRESDAYKLNISGNIDDIPTKLPRKICKITKSKNTDKSTGQIRIKEIKNDEYIGIEIDGNQRFLINDFTVTHNCSNIFSKLFEIETVDSTRKLLFKQKFEENMTQKSEAVITKYTKKPYTTIRFLPDYVRFGMPSLSEDMYLLMQKRSYDACAVTDNTISVYFNNLKLEYKNFEKYVDLFLGPKVEHDRVYEKISERWEVAASYNNFNGLEQMSFVNGINTIRGGKHVEYILNQIVKKLTDLIQKKKKDITVKPQTIKDNLILFVKSTIVNPSFDSQSKETLTTPITKFGSKAELSEKFIEKLYKSGIVEKILEISNIHNNKQLAKTDGKKRTVIRGLAQLEDANWAGGPKSKECILILTEGNSAMSMAVAGISEVGRDRFGVFPLKGKLMNVKDQTCKRIAENDEISNIKKILGLETGKTYDSVDDLRYGKIMLMTDSDEDGHHIKALIFNMFHSMWPSLIKCNEFMSSMLTPIIKVTKSNNTNQFYNLTDYNNWTKTTDTKGWEIKYYKGLGTSTSEEAVQYFRDLKLVDYKYTGETSTEKLNLAFDKKKADERKDWLEKYDKQLIINSDIKEVSYEDFIDKVLIHFSNYDVERSIPNMCDGLKTSQRKILFACFKKNLVKEIKVAQLAGYVSENAAYHHGEASLQSAIIGMAQNFLGSNNINVLKPNGQFGTRRLGGQDAASPRYIFTQLSDLTNLVFNKEDNQVLTYQNDDGMDVEPEYYMPIIPMILVNGAIGIGTGFSTNIPCYNPLDIVRVLKHLLSGVEDIIDDLIPWYNGFKGKIEKNDKDKFVSRGIYTKTTSTKIDITELPVGTWTQNFKELLEEYLEKSQDIKNYESHYTETDIRFTLQFANSSICDAYTNIEDNGYSKLENELKLVSSKNLSTSNMYLFNSKCQIHKYDSALDIIRDFYNIRLSYYQKRKDKILESLLYSIELLNNKIRFIREVVSENLKVHKMKKIDLEDLLKTDKYMLHNDSYDYLFRIPIYNLTIDKVTDLEQEKAKADEEIDRVKSLDIKTMWIQELDQFVLAYNKSLLVVEKKTTVKKTVVKKK